MNQDDGAVPGAAPVARFDGLGAEAEAPAPAARFDEIADQTAAPVAELDDLDGHDDADDDVADDVAETAPVAGLIGIGGARPELPRVMRLSDLGTSHRKPRERSGGSATTRPPPTPGAITTSRPRRSRRQPDSAHPGPGFGPGPAEELADPAGSTESAGRGRRPRRGEPVELPPGTDPVAAAKEICLRLLSDRARTRQELARVLARKGIPDDAAGSVLERFDEVGLIDDAAFAGQWVRSRHNHKGLARRAIAMELRRKGVDDEVAGEALEEVDAESEEKRAEELVKRKLRSITVSTPEQKASTTRRLVGMLARKGYGAGTAYRVVKQALAEHDIDLDEFGADSLSMVETGED